MVQTFLTQAIISLAPAAKMAIIKKLNATTLTCPAWFVSDSATSGGETVAEDLPDMVLGSKTGRTSLGAFCSR